MFVVRRSPHNPIILPSKTHHWESFATFNWSPVQKDDTTHVFYRAMSYPELLGNNRLTLSTIGHATSKDGHHYQNRKQSIVPENDWEQFGCEDPRVTELDGKYYIFYTALSNYPFNADGIKVAVAITKDLETIDEKHLVTPFNAKAMALFPKKIGGKFYAILTVNTDRPPSKIAVAEFEKEEDLWSEDFWNQWYEHLDDHSIELNRGDDDHVEVGAQPIETEAGWLLLYSHTEGYFSGRHKTYGVEAVLLDKDNPREIIGRTTMAMLVPESIYEKRGNVSNIVFPSGALVRGDNLEIYYGSADTTCCMASVNLKNLLQGMVPESRNNLVKRFSKNPIIIPNSENDWESKATFNPAAVDLEGKVHILYRAMSKNNTSTMGYAMSSDGFNIDERLSEPAYVPREDFEKKKSPGNSGCEDPRLVQIENKLYMFYTAFDGIRAPRVAATSIDVDSFLKKKWDWSKPILITPPDIMDKNASLFSEKINGKYMFIHRVGEVICIDMLEGLDFEKYKVTKCIQLIKPRHGLWDEKKVGLSAPPIKTDHGWILLYHGISRNNTYRVGAILLDKNDPTIVHSRTTAPILEPIEEYEKHGQVPNVVFPCGAINRNGTIHIYYGGADSVVGVATIELSTLIEMLSL